MAQEPTCEKLKQRVEHLEKICLEQKAEIDRINLSQTELALILSNVPMFMMIVDQDRRVKKISNSLLQFVDKTEEEVLGSLGGEVLGCIYHKDNQKGCGFGDACRFCKIKQTVEDTLKFGNSHQKVESLLPIIGDVFEKRTLLISTAPIGNPDRQAIVFVEDISEKKKNEERLSLALKGANDGLWDYRPVTGQIYFSPQWKGMLGYKEDELENSLATWENLLAPEDKSKALETLEKYLNGGTEYYYSEFKMCHKNGTYRHILSRAFSRIDSDGQICRLVGTHVDITELKKAEADLRESEKRLSLAAESGDLGMFEWQIDTGVSIVTDKWLEVAGISRQEYDARYNPLTLESLQKYIHPDDWGRLFDAIQEHFIGEMDRINSEYRFDSPVKGRWIWLSAIGQVAERNEQGEPIRLVGFQQDITEKKETEIALKQNQVRLQKYADTQATLLQEVNHRVKNNLTAIISMLHIEEDRTTNHGNLHTLNSLETLKNRVSGLLTVHGLLSAGEWEPLELSTLCREVVLKSLQGMSPSGEFDLVVEPVFFMVQSDMAHHLTLILNELATNTVKYGVAGNGSIDIKIFFKERTDTVCLIYSDKGSGFPENILCGKVDGNSIGIEMIDSIVKGNMCGQIKRYNRDGAVIEICFPR